MKKYSWILAGILLLFVSACSTVRKTAGPPSGGRQDDGKFSFGILAMNDVYEISPLEGGKSGGLARVATVKKQLYNEMPYLVTLHAGDFLNPSLLGNLKYEGKKIKGRQMVEVMNALGIDWVVPGNHEFDLSRKDLQARIDESRFGWVVANAFEVLPDTVVPFHKNLPGGRKKYFPAYAKWEVTDADGTHVRIGIVAVTIPFDVKAYAKITNPVAAVDSTLKKLGDCDLIIGLTHLDWKDDVAIAEKFPQIDLIIGGHDHYHMVKETSHATVTKADANAKTVFVHRITVFPEMDSVHIDSELKELNESVPLDSTVNAIVQKWEVIGREAVKAAGIDPDKVIATLPRPLDGREIAIRDHPTGLGILIAKAMRAASQNNAECAILNSGSVRIDDFVEGDITGTDIMRILPYGGPIFDFEIEGGLLRQALDAGRANRGKGGYLQLANIQYDKKNSQWLVGGEPLRENKKYRCVAPKFLLQGREAGLEFLNEKNPGLTILKEKRTPELEDIRRALAQYLQTQNR